MTNYQLNILRTIALHQPILKFDLYRILSMSIPDHYRILGELRDEGYIRFERKRGPVWLTLRGLEAIE